MVEQHQTQQPSGPGTILPAYRWLALLFAVLVIIQAFLGSRGVFDANEGMITAHEMLANLMFLMVVGQTVLSWVLYSRKTIGMVEAGLNAVLVLLTVAQIGLGYSTRSGENYATTVSLHIPNGVLLMGISTVVVTLAWRSRSLGAHSTGIS